MILFSQIFSIGNLIPKLKLHI